MEFHIPMPLRRAAVAILALVLCFAAQAQDKTATAPASPRSTKPAVTSNEDAQLYHNITFGFRYQIPYGWVDRTQEMNTPDPPANRGAQDKKNEDASTKSKPGPDAAGKAEVLLAVFERPPEATGDSINSAVVFASESAASYPGLKKAEDYLGPLTELATSKGFESQGEPYTVDVESRQLLRADFVKPRGDKLTMRQCTLVLLAKGRIVSFTFIAGSEDELDDLMDGLHFSVAKSPAH
jgi:hypothetical protein